MPNTSDAASQGQMTMLCISSGHNPVLHTAADASQGETAMSCEMTQDPTQLIPETRAISKQKNTRKSQRHHPYKTQSNGKHQQHKCKAARQQLTLNNVALCDRLIYPEEKKQKRKTTKQQQKRVRQEHDQHRQVQAVLHLRPMCHTQG